MTDIADRLNDLPPRDPRRPAEQQGLFQKFIVTRTDGSSGPGGKHEGCEYFVLDVDHDPLHKPALEAYADACESTHPQLAADLRTRYHLQAAGEMVSVPILDGFDADKPIGQLRVRRDSLPPTPNFCFSIGYQVDGYVDDRITGYSLQSVAIIPDADYRKVIDREQARQDTPQLYGSQERILRRRARAFGIARDVADGFAARRGEGGQTATYRQLVNMLLSEPEVVTAIADWRQAAREAVDAVDQAPIPAGYSDHERPSATLARHEQLAVRCTLSAYHEEWWRLHRDLQQSQRELVALMADGFKARRKAAAGMNLSQGKPTAVHASPVIVETTAMWAGAQTAQSDGAVHFSAEAWAKFVKCLGEEPPLEILTSPGISAPAHLVHPTCARAGCEQPNPCDPGKCALGPGDAA